MNHNNDNTPIDRDTRFLKHLAAIEEILWCSQEGVLSEVTES